MFMKWSHLPWKHFKDPFVQWEELPTFLMIEYVCYILVIVSLIHATKNGRTHIMIWLASFITGSANDIFFMALPLVDNFWQAQTTIMITPRLPLYICCVYNIFMYYSMVASWRFGFENKWPEACLTGLLALLIYYPYDLVGAKHLWWTWHTTDPPIIHRIFGVPIGSTLWILTFSACFSLIITLFYGKWRFSIITTLIFSALLSTPLMMFIMATLQLISLETQGEPTHVGLIVCLCFYGVALLISTLLLVDTKKSFKWLKHRYAPKWDPLLGVALLLYYGVIWYSGNSFNPEKFISTGIHQSFGPCDIRDTDFTGLSRSRYVCKSNLKPEWNVQCDPILSKLNSNDTTIYSWYSVCGTSHNITNNSSWTWLNQLNTVLLISSFSFIIIYIFIPLKYAFRNNKNLKKEKIKQNKKNKKLKKNI